MKLFPLAFVFSVSLILPVITTADPVWNFQNNSQEYENMTMETYEIALAKALQREKNARESIAQEQGLIENLKQRLNDMDNRIAEIVQEKYDILGINEHDVINAENEITSIRQELEMLLGLMPEELLQRSNEIVRQESRIVSLKEKPVSYLWKIRDQIGMLDRLLNQVKAKVPEKLFRYTVKNSSGKRDCLYRIAEYSNVYDDPTQWPKLYRANKSIIDSEFNRYLKNTKNPKYSRPEDLILPGQIFDIPR